MMKFICTSGYFLMLLLNGFNTASAQISINNTSISIASGTTVSVRGDISSNGEINGEGKLLLNGNTLQNLNMNGYAISNLEVDNDSINLVSDLSLPSSVLFSNGKIVLGNNNVTLASGTVCVGMGSGKFFETNGTGYVKRILSADATDVIFPTGNGDRYLPLTISNMGAGYNAAFIACRSKATAATNIHPRTESYLNAHWQIIKSGITGGTTYAKGNYGNDNMLTGSEDDLTGLFFNGSTWSNVGSTHSATLNNAGAAITGNGGVLYAMNTFVLLNPKVILQGAYNNSTGFMNDRLRTNMAYNVGSLPNSNLIPFTDPYRSNDYNFIHVNNTAIENVISPDFPNPLIDQINPENNIVDWVFLELRNANTPGNSILQTRSALLQRDGDIVDIDGVSPVYFKNATAGAGYTVAVKHRNHLAISTNPATFSKELFLTASTLDLVTMNASNLMGTPNINFFQSSGKNMLYAGNTNSNNTIRWNAPSSDKDFILITILNSNATSVLSNVYSPGDIDLNRNVRWNAPASDKDFLLSTPLNNSSITVKTQSLPN